jgi:hypothetical protein
MQERVPALARDVLSRQSRVSSVVHRAVQELARAIESDACLPPPTPPAPDLQPWLQAHAEHAGETWLGTEWFHAELAFYRELMGAFRFWETGVDPFAPIKSEELAGERPWERLAAAVHGLATLPREEKLALFLEQCLWGNRVDLSYTVAAARAHVHDDDLLVDDRAAVISRLSASDAHVHIVADNTGAELALDLALIDALLESESARVTLHLKLQPVFVSDATVHDVWCLLDAMGRRPAARNLSTRLREHFDAGSLTLASDPFWSGPRFMAQAPPHIVRALDAAAVVILKGDANYRRLVGDALWEPEAPFAYACRGIAYPLIACRTMKSDAVLGLPPGLAARLDALDPDWRINGKRGVLQAHVPTPR